VEYILGLKLHGDHFTVEPCIPSHWPGYSMIYRYGGSTYRIEVAVDEGRRTKDEGATVAIHNGQSPASRRHTSHVEVMIDGVSVPDGKVPMVDDGQTHEVLVSLSASKIAGHMAKAASEA
jgi:cyclic beta-1,2-glucan synthetase